MLEAEAPASSAVLQDHLEGLRITPYPTECAPSRLAPHNSADKTVVGSHIGTT